MDSLDFTIVESPLGRVLIAASAAGIGWLGFGDTDEQALAEIRCDFGAHALSRNDFALRKYAEPVAGFLKGCGPCPALAIDPGGTEFQRRVWNELCAIPPGDTLAYGEIAARIERPRALRAVAAAVGANPVAVLIPCHRALAKDGSLHNYRYGIDRKRRLLELEGVSLGKSAAPAQAVMFT